MQDLPEYNQAKDNSEGTDLGIMAEMNKQQMQHAVAKVNSMHNRTEYGGFKFTQSRNDGKNWQ